MKAEARQRRIGLLREQVRRLEVKIRRLETEDRRERQAERMCASSVMPWWAGTIDDYCADMVYHAKRLREQVRGSFNDVPLKAYPDSDPEKLVQGYYEAAR